VSFVLPLDHLLYICSLFKHLDISFHF